MSKHEKIFLTLAVLHAIVYVAFLVAAGNVGTDSLIYPNDAANVDLWVFLDSFSSALIPGVTFGKHLPASFILTVWGSILTSRKFRQESSRSKWVLLTTTLISGIPLLSLLGIFSFMAALMKA